MNNIITEIADLALSEGFNREIISDFEARFHDKQELTPAITELMQNEQFNEITQHVLQSHNMPVDSLINILSHEE